MAKYSIYAVAYGIDPTTQIPVMDMKFSSWQECLPYINGVEGANYKGFLTDTEADIWLSRQNGMPRNIAKTQARNPSPIRQTHTQKKPKASPVLNQTREEIKADFAEKCIKLGADPNTVMYELMSDWLRMVDTLGIVPSSTSTESEDDEPPWFD